MTVNQALKRTIIKKTIVLICIAAFFAALCFLTNDHKGISRHYKLTYTLASVAISLLALLFIAWKMRYFHNLFGKEWTGTVLCVKREIIRSRRALMSMDDVVLLVKIDGKKRKKKIRLPGNKVGRNVYFEGDRIHRLKGTRFPINLTREVEQHICPLCGRDSCLDDECPDCKIRY